MGEDIITAVCDMLLPLTMLGLGLIVWLTKPGYGDAFGYRTTWSLKSKETWTRAQGLFGSICTKSYAVLSFLTLLSGVLIIITDTDDIAPVIVVNAVNLVNFIALFVIIGVTDGIIKREFDKDGNRKEDEIDE